MARGKVRKGRGGRVMMQRKAGSKGMGDTPAKQGKVIYCERCATVGVHRGFEDLRVCYGRHAKLGVDFRWVKP